MPSTRLDDAPTARDVPDDIERRTKYGLRIAVIFPRRGFTETRVLTLFNPSRTTSLISRNYGIKSHQVPHSTTFNSCTYVVTRRTRRRIMEREMNARLRCGTTWRPYVSLPPAPWPINCRWRALINLSVLGVLPSSMRDKRDSLADSDRGLLYSARCDSNYRYASKYHRRNDLWSIGTVDTAETVDRRFDLDSSVSNRPLLWWLETNDTLRVPRYKKRATSADSLCIIFTCPRENRAHAGDELFERRKRLRTEADEEEGTRRAAPA